MRLHTRTLTSGSVTIVASDGVTQISVQANPSSSGTVTGNFPFQGTNANAITLQDGQALTITTPTNSPLDGVVIAWVSGSIDLVIGF